jgi:hypothetical protein
LRAEPLPPHRPSIGEHHDSRRARWLGRRRGLRIGQKRAPEGGKSAMSLRHFRYAV